MPSMVDVTTPQDGVPSSKADIRANWARIKTEIEALQEAPAQAAEFVNVVRDFGAVPERFVRGGGSQARVEPTTDNTAAIQGAIDAAGAKPQGGIVYVPPGAYGVRGLRMSPRVQLCGAGKASVLFLLDGSNTHLLQHSTNTEPTTGRCPDEGYWVRNITLNANYGGQAPGDIFCIRFILTRNESRIMDNSHFTAQTPRMLIQNVWLQDGTIGLYYDGYGENHFDNIQGEWLIEYGMYLNSFDNWITNCSFGDVGHAGILGAASAANNRYMNCKVFFSGSADWWVSTKAGHGIQILGNTNTLVGCEVQDTYGDAFRIDGRFNVLNGCYADGVGSLGAGGRFHTGISPKDSYGFRFTGNANWNRLAGCMMSDRYVRDSQGGPYGEYALGLADSANCHSNQIDLTAPAGHQTIALHDMNAGAIGRNPHVLVNGAYQSLPTSDPGIPGAPWNDGGFLRLSPGQSVSLDDGATTLLSDAGSGVTVFRLAAAGTPPITYTITGGNGAGHFEIVGDEIRTTAAYDGGTASYALSVEADNGIGASDTATVTITRVTLGAAAFSDAFDRADQDLEADASWTLLDGLAGGAGVRSNQLAALAGSGQIATYRCATDLGSADQWLRFRLRTTGSSASFVCCRMSGADSWVGVRHNADAGVGLQLFKRTSETPGEFDNIGQTNQLAAIDDEITLTVAGDTARVYRNGGQVLEASLGGHASTGSFGGVVTRVTANNPWIDDLRFGAL